MVSVAQGRPGLQWRFALAAGAAQPRAGSVL